MNSSLYDGVIGQDRALAALEAAAARPVHAYLFVGPPGTGKRRVAIGFAAALLCASSPPDPGCESCRRVLAGVHPDVVSVEREGASITIGAAREVTMAASTSPVEGERKVIILHDFHLVQDAAPALLKTIEEPPPTTVFVILAEHLPAELVTIASRCVQVAFEPLTPAAITAALIDDGVGPDEAVQLADASGGRLDRARLLAGDPEFERRRQAWQAVPSQLDGTGATAAALADQLVGLLDSSVAPLKARQAEELAALLERNERMSQVVGSSARGGKAAKGAGRPAKGAQSAGVREVDDRHRREQRRQRTDELRAGLAALAAAYRDRMADATDARRRAQAMDAVGLVDKLSKDLMYNPGELLAIQGLLVRLGRVALLS